MILMGSQDNNCYLIDALDITKLSINKIYKHPN